MFNHTQFRIAHPSVPGWGLVITRVSDVEYFVTIEVHTEGVNEIFPNALRFKRSNDAYEVAPGLVPESLITRLWQQMYDDPDLEHYKEWWWNLHLMIATQLTHEPA